MSSMFRLMSLARPGPTLPGACVLWDTSFPVLLNHFCEDISLCTAEIDKRQQEVVFAVKDGVKL